MAEHPHEHKHECRRLLASLSDYVDGLLDDELCREIEAHMDDCDDCRIVVNTLAKTVELYRAAPAPDLPAAVAQRLYTSLNLDDFLRQPAPAEDEPGR